MSEPVVILRDVHKSFGPLHVLDGVSFTVAPGTVTAIIGRSGSGKSTALRCIDRLERIDAGEIIVGHPMTPVTAIARPPQNMTRIAPIVTLAPT